jgi:uncharacterized membrane protein YidH (DUF202 family)
LTAPPEDLEDADPVLARERTELAWTRTAISFAALGIAILRSRPAAGVPVLIFSAVIWRIGRLSRAPGQSRAAARRVLLTTVAITAMALAALLITVVGPGSRGLRL